MLAPSDLRAFQVEAIEFGYLNPFSALWLDMGLGKTSSALTIIMRLLGYEESNLILIVAPLQVALNTWPNEIAKWSHTKNLEYTIIRAFGNEPECAEARARSKAMCKAYGLSSEHTRQIVGRAQTLAEQRVKTSLLYSGAPVHIINREAFPWLVEHFGDKFPYDTIFWDESSGLRDRNSHRFKAMVFARKFLRRHHQLTGTPAPESFMDLFTQIYLLDRGKRFGKFISRFRKEYFGYNPYTREYSLLAGAADKIIEQVHGVVLDMRAEDYLDILQPIFVDVSVELSESERAQYERLEETCMLTMPDGQEIEAENAPALMQKLLQYASGSVYGEEHKAQNFHNHKIDALRQIAEEAQGAPIIVAYWFKPSLARLKKEFPHARTVKELGREAEKEWNAGKIPILLLHPGSGAHGLNLQFGGHIVVWFDICYPFELYDQTNHRIVRQGQTKVPRIFHLITRGTLDETIVPKLKKKEKSQAYLFDRLRELRRRAQLRKARR